MSDLIERAQSAILNSQDGEMSSLLGDLWREIARLRAENENLIQWNHSVRACAVHTGAIIGDGCVLCDLERLQAVVDAARMERLQAVVDAAREARDLWREYLDFGPEMVVLDEKLRALGVAPLTHSTTVTPSGTLDKPCPMCKGRGSLPYMSPGQVATGNLVLNADGEAAVKCPGCHGRGTLPIVVVGTGEVKSEPCQTCGGTRRVMVPVGEHFVTRDMAIDGGMPDLEGASMGVEYEERECPTCDAGEPCPTCKGRGLTHNGEPYRDDGEYANGDVVRVCDSCGGTGVKP